jgi:repressor LexA
MKGWWSCGTRSSGIRVTNYHEAPEEVELPFLGYIAAGKPIEAIENPEPVCLAAWTRGGRECYVLGVKGESMIEDGILDGDWVVIERRDWAHDGEVVVALIDGSEATLKRIEQRAGKVTLHPANSGMSPISYPPDRVTIQGVVIGLIRNTGSLARGAFSGHIRWTESLPSMDTNTRERIPHLDAAIALAEQRSWNHQAARGCRGGRSADGIRQHPRKDELIDAWFDQRH